MANYFIFYYRKQNIYTVEGFEYEMLNFGFDIKYLEFCH